MWGACNVPNISPPFPNHFLSSKLISPLCSSTVESNCLETKIYILCFAGSKMLVRAAKCKFCYADFWGNKKISKLDFIRGFGSLIFFQLHVNTQLQLNGKARETEAVAIDEKLTERLSFQVLSTIYCGQKFESLTNFLKHRYAQFFYT